MEALFRAYHRESEKMIYQLADENTTIFWHWFESHKCSSPMAYIGLIDKNGRKGYVGDYYKRQNYLYEIVYDEKTFAYKGVKVARLSDFDIESITDKINYKERHWIKEMGDDKLYNISADDTTEIVGNIYEDLFLIKNKN
jgi:hypothetical protein